MNLTSKQISALADNLAKRIGKERNSKREALKKTLKVSLTAAEKTTALKNALNNKFKEVLQKESTRLGFSDNYYLSREIEGKIIVASIDSTDLESLTKAILKDYK